MDTDFANIIGMFKRNTDSVTKAIAEVSSERWFDKPGDDSNHLMWVLGHLVWSRANVLKTVNENWEMPSASLFNRGAALTDKRNYPSVEETLSKPAAQGPPSFGGKVSGVVAFLAFHETYHVGQVSYLKKWLGYGQTVG